MSEAFALHPQLAADTVDVADFRLCTLRLMNCRAVPWLILVPRRGQITEIIDLPAGEQLQLMEEIAITSSLLRNLFAPRKINVAALGNVVSQLHVHVIARSENDGAWPKPVWGNLPMDTYTVAEQTEMVGRLRTHLAAR
jgi:diadenosine tetraphosphate (Ap4A) HIT family hydrolase